MKYIRTKDGIFEGYKTVIKKFAENKVIFAQAEVIMDGIIKTADTIEELCDDFIVTATSHYTAYIAQTHTLEETIEYCENNHMPKTKIRGAIWTNKGLIYVAKMNEKGELELL